MALLQRKKALVDKFLKMKSIPLCRRSLGEIRRIGVPERILYGILGHLLKLYDDENEPEESVKIEEEMLEICERQSEGSFNQKAKVLLCWLAEDYMSLKYYDKSQNAAIRCINMGEEIDGKDHSFLTLPLETLAEINSKTHNFEKEVECLQRAIDIVEKTEEEKLVHTRNRLRGTLGICEINRKNYANAEEILKDLLNEASLEKPLWQTAEEFEVQLSCDEDIPYSNEPHVDLGSSRQTFLVLSALAFLYRRRKMYTAAECLSRQSFLVRAKQKEITRTFREIRLNARRVD